MGNHCLSQNEADFWYTYVYQLRTFILYFYVYKLTNVENGMQYIGKRNSLVPPDKDITYMGSSKYVPKDECIKTILSVHTTALEATEEEIRLHNYYDVAVNPMFYNRSKQTSTKFDTTGLTFHLTQEQKDKLSKSSRGTPKTLTEEQRENNKKHLAKYRTKEIHAKASATLKVNGSNKGVKNSQFEPWYISTETVTHLFFSITKAEKAVLDGFKNVKHYVDIQRKLTGAPHKHRIYGNITAIGSIPKQCKI